MTYNPLDNAQDFADKHGIPILDKIRLTGIPFKMQIKITPETSYRVELPDGRYIGNFTKGEEWQGMVLLKDGNKTIVVEGMDWHNDIIKNIFGVKSTDTFIGDVVKASPMALNLLLEPPAKPDALQDNIQ